MREDTSTVASTVYVFYLDILQNNVNCIHCVKYQFYKDQCIQQENQSISGLKIINNNMVTIWGYYESYHPEKRGREANSCLVFSYSLVNNAGLLPLAIVE